MIYRESFATYGTLLEIRDVQYLSDGRSFVDTIGSRRFKVISRGLRDGYHTAWIQLIRDNIVIESQEQEGIIKLLVSFNILFYYYLIQGIP